MSLVRVLRTAQVTLTHVFRVDGAPTDASGAVTVTARRLDGTLVDTAAAGHPDLGTYTYALPEQANLDTLTVDWVGSVAGADVTARDYVEIVGGFFFGLAEVRERQKIAPSIGEQRLAEARIEVEQECERICGQGFVPRFARVALDGNGGKEVLLPRGDVRALRALTVAGTAYSPEQLAAVEWSESGVLCTRGWWPPGRRNIIAEFEYGMDYPPEPIRTAGMAREKSLLSQPSSAVPDRAATFTTADGGVYRLSLPTREQTGIADVDGAYAKFTVDIGGFA